MAFKARAVWLDNLQNGNLRRPKPAEAENEALRYERSQKKDALKVRELYRGFFAAAMSAGSS